MNDCRLSAQSRASALADLENSTFDLLVIGGGVTGAGIALDAASRGMKVALVEQGDLASGTSSRSSKMIHGGLRYLEQLRFGLVREALHERNLLLTRIAPHLVRPVPFLFPIKHWWQRYYLGVGLKIYDYLGGRHAVPATRYLSHAGTSNAVPSLDPGLYRAAFQFWDAQEDDARFVICLARTAAKFGAKIATRTRVADLISEKGRITGAALHDLEADRAFNVRARHVATAMGAWTGKSRTGPVLRPSKGIHLVLAHEAIHSTSGIIAPTETGLLFVIPWEGYWLVGDTDTPWQGDPGAADPSEKDIEVLVGRLNAVLSTQINLHQILACFAGVRPLAASAVGGDTKSISRSHVIFSDRPGLTSIMGGKFTTYRKMAVDTVDHISGDFEEFRTAKSWTERIPLIGAEWDPGDPANVVETAKAFNCDPMRAVRLLERYGATVSEVLEMIRRDPDLGEPLPKGWALKAEIAHACTHEGAIHLDDLMDRRFRLGFVDASAAANAAADVAVVAGRVLGWDDMRRREEIQAYRDAARRTMPSEILSKHLPG